MNHVIQVTKTCRPS